MGGREWWFAFGFWFGVAGGRQRLRDGRLNKFFHAVKDEILAKNESEKTKMTHTHTKKTGVFVFFRKHEILRVGVFIKIRLFFFFRD